MNNNIQVINMKEKDNNDWIKKVSTYPFLNLKVKDTIYIEKVKEKNYTLNMKDSSQVVHYLSDEKKIENLISSNKNKNIVIYNLLFINNVLIKSIFDLAEKNEIFIIFIYDKQIEEFDQKTTNRLTEFGFNFDENGLVSYKDNKIKIRPSKSFDILTKLKDTNLYETIIEVQKNLFSKINFDNETTNDNNGEDKRKEQNKFLGLFTENYLAKLYLNNSVFISKQNETESNSNFVYYKAFILEILKKYFNDNIINLEKLYEAFLETYASNYAYKNIKWTSFQDDSLMEEIDNVILFCNTKNKAFKKLTNTKYQSEFIKDINCNLKIHGYVDFLNDEKYELFEVKYSTKIDKYHLLQIMFYIYLFTNKYKTIKKMKINILNSKTKDNYKIAFNLKEINEINKIVNQIIHEGE